MNVCSAVVTQPLIGKKESLEDEMIMPFQGISGAYFDQTIIFV